MDLTCFFCLALDYKMCCITIIFSNLTIAYLSGLLSNFREKDVVSLVWHGFCDIDTHAWHTRISWFSSYFCEWRKKKSRIAACCWKRSHSPRSGIWLQFDPCISVDYNQRNALVWTTIKALQIKNLIHMFIFISLSTFLPNLPFDYLSIYWSNPSTSRIPPFYLWSTHLATVYVLSFCTWWRRNDPLGPHLWPIWFWPREKRVEGKIEAHKNMLMALPTKPKSGVRRKDSKGKR
jgi:hypothetical protein